MDCCYQKTSSEEAPHSFHSLHQNDHLALAPPTKTEKSIPIPKLSVSLDLPGYTDYLPTYWPGQKITGEITIELLSPIKVSSLRVILFGQVQVHGEKPGKPLTNGMFDYLKNIQIVNKGLQVTHRSQSTLSNEDDEEGDRNSNTETAADPCWRIYCKNSRNSSVGEGNHSNGNSNNNNNNNYEYSDNNSNTNNYNSRSTGEPKKKLKTAEDRQIEKLVKEITTFCDSTGIRIDSPHHNKQPKAEFELNANKHRIRFAMDTPDKLPSSFDHPHFPISYSIVVLMTCRPYEEACFTLYATERIRLERFLQVDLSQHTEAIQTAFAYRYVPKNNGLISNLFSSSLHLIKASLPPTNLKPMSRTTLEQNKYLSSYDSYLNVYFQLPKQAYEPCQQVPLQLKLLNTTTSFRICAIKTEIRLIRRINMSCNLGEEVEGIVLDSAQLVFQNMPQQQQGLDFSKLTFDLSEILKIPKDVPNSISNEATKDVFSMSYNYHATVYVTGEITNGVELDPKEKTYFIQQRHVQHLSSLRKLNCCSENHHHKTYLFELDPLVITVGRFANGPI